MPQTPDANDQAPDPYVAPDPVAPPEASVPTDPILRSTEFRRTAKKGVRRPIKAVNKATFPEAKTVIATEVTLVTGEDYVKVKAQEVNFRQSDGRYPVDVYGLIYDDDKVEYGSEPSIIVSASAGLAVPPSDATISETFTAVPDEDGGWTGVTGGGGGGGDVVSVIKITSALSISTYLVSVLDNSVTQNPVQTGVTMYIAGNSRTRLPVNLVLVGLKQADGSYVGQQSLIF